MLLSQLDAISGSKQQRSDWPQKDVKIAIREGMTPMIVNGIRKAAEGIVSLVDVFATLPPVK